MRKFLGFCFLILCTASLYAQTTSVTGTITDSNSVVWANSSWTLSFVPSQQQPNINAYTIGGVPLSSTVINQTGVANSSGVFSFTVYQIGSINPSGGQFKLVICPTASVPCSQLLFTTGSNSTLDLSSQMTAAFKPPSFVAVPGTFGYDDSEATLALRIANTYFNVTLGVNHVWNGSAWINPGGGGGVSEILEGTNVTCSPLVSSSCVGNVTINSTASGGGGNYVNLSSTVTCTETTGSCICSGGYCTVGTASASVIISGIPSSVNLHLGIVGSLITLDTIDIQFNSDTTSGNYFCYRFSNAGDNSCGLVAPSGTIFLADFSPSSGSSTATVDINNALGTGIKGVTSTWYDSQEPAAGVGSGTYIGTSAISSFTLEPFTGGNMIAAGTIISIYGTD